MSSNEVRTALLVGADFGRTGESTAKLYEDTANTGLRNYIHAYGFGKLNAANSLDLINDNRFPNIISDFVPDSTATKKYRIMAESGDEVKVLMSWNVEATGNPLNTSLAELGRVPLDSLKNYNLKVTKPDGTAITSDSAAQNKEFVFFNADQSGIYEITITVDDQGLRNVGYALGSSHPIDADPYDLDFTSPTCQENPNCRPGIVPIPMISIMTSPATPSSGDTVTLDASGSTGTGDLSFRWIQLHNSGFTEVKLRNPDTATATFVVPSAVSPSTAEVIFQVTVTDDRGPSSEIVRMDVRLTNLPTVIPPLPPGDGSIETVLFSDQFDGFGSWDEHTEWDIAAPEDPLTGIDTNNKVADIEQCASICHMELHDAIELRGYDGAELRFYMWFGDDIREDDSADLEGAMIESRQNDQWSELEMIMFEGNPFEEWFPVVISLDRFINGEAKVRFSPMLEDDDSIIQVDAVEIVGKTQDTTAPVFSPMPTDLNIDSESSGGTIVTYTNPTATDNVDGAVDVFCNPQSDMVYPIGTTTVTCMAQDSSGNMASVSFDIIVQFVDTTPPQFMDIPANITVSTTNPTHMVQFDLPEATDNSGSANVVCTPASGSSFQIGTTTVTCTATDPSNNSNSVSFDVIVLVTDTTPPEFPDMPEDIRTVITGQVSPIDFDLPAATDDSGIVNVVCDPASGSTFQLGTTTVTCTATDPTGNFVTTSFNVIVLPPDTTPPRFPDTPENITVSTTGQLEIVQFDLPAATDDFGTVNVVCDPAAGSSFPIGTTTVTCTATDPTGNSITTSFNVTVLDNTAPQFTNMPRDIGSSITNQSIRISFSLPAATDNSGTVNVVCDPAPGSVFPIGTTTVTCTATDPSNNSDSVSFNVIITAEDTTAPQFTEIPDDITVETATQSAVVQFELPHATDASGSYTLSCNPSSGSSFQIGTTTVTCTATDPSGNVGTVSFDVIVQAVEDTTPPQFTYAPEDVTLETTLLSLVVTFSLPPATDDFGSVSVVCDPASGSTFRLGTTTITCTATDSSGNFATTSYDLTLRLLDTTPPRFSDTLENITIQTVTSSAVVQFDLPVATDNLGSVSVVCDPASGSIFQIGTTTVTCTATDDSDNSATASFDVIVEAVPDTTMPQFTSIPENVIVSTTAQSITVQFDLPVATDDSGSVSVVCDPESGSTFQSGTTTVTCTATDDSNNTDTTSFDVIVGTPPDVTPPQFSGTPADITVHAGGQSHIVQFDLPPATDDSGSVSVVCDPESGSTFQFGTTTVTCTATDDSNNSNTVSFDVIVRAPAPILNFELNPTGTTIHVDWISSSSTGYKAIIYPTSDGLSSRIVGTTNETHFTFINLEPETEYTVEVQARMHPQTRTMLSTTTLEAPEEPELQFTPSIVSDQILFDITNNLNLVVDYKYFAEYSTNGTSFTSIIGSLGSPRHVDIVEDMIGTDVHLRIYQNIGGQKLYSDTVILPIPDLVPPANFAISQNADTLELSWDPTLARKYIIRGDGFSEPVPYGTNSLSIPITDDMRGETVTYTIQSQFREHRSATSSASIAIP